MDNKDNYKTIVYEKKGFIAKIRLNLPERRNVVDLDLLKEFKHAITEVKNDKTLRALIITGSGKAFCSGADLGALTGFAQDSGFEGIAGIREGVIKIYESLLMVLNVEIPTIASINGYTIGAGVGLALACDIRIASDVAKFSTNFANLGIHPGMAITYMLPLFIGRGRACDMLFTGRMIDAAEAERIGLVEKVVPADTLDKETFNLAETISLSAPYVLRLAKKAVYKGINFSPQSGMEYESVAQTLCSQMGDAEEGIKAFFEKRKPEFKGK